MTAILITGGAGFVGCHTVRELARQGFYPLSFDNLSEGHREAVVEGDLIVGDLSNEVLLESVFEEYKVDAVMHFASRCYVEESVEDPRFYYEQNVGNALTLLRVMLRKGVKQFVFSSTCAIYGLPQKIPISENHPQIPINPYGETKLFIEKILNRYEPAYGLRSVCLRYFNAAGASLDGQIGESHYPETHLIPRALKAVSGELPSLQMFGGDFPTSDGSAVRDYIHVEDLASAHVSALRWLKEGHEGKAFNLGTGHGHSVKQVLQMVEQVTGKRVPVEQCPRRDGDPPALVADPRRANQLLKWKPHHSDLQNMISSAWIWEQQRKY